MELINNKSWMGKLLLQGQLPNMGGINLKGKKNYPLPPWKFFLCHSMFNFGSSFTLQVDGTYKVVIGLIYIIEI